MTPVDLEAEVRRSSRNALAPKRLSYSPGGNPTPQKKKVRDTSETHRKQRVLLVC